MSRINRLPWGLQDLLGSTSQGDNPSDLLQDVRGSFDMFPFWGMERVSVFHTSFEITALNVDATIKVPQGEVWIPMAMTASVFGFQTVGDQVAISFQLQDLARMNITIIPGFLDSSPVWTALQIGEVRGHSYNFPFPFVAQSGMEFIFKATTALQLGVNNQVTIAVYYWQFKV